MQKTTTFLMFVGDQCGKAEEAMALYTSLFDNSSILHIERFGENEPGGRAGTVKMATFVIAGQEYIANDSAADHAFAFTPSISIYVSCADEEELERCFGLLSAGGEVLMPVNNYGFSKKFGWTADKYGVSWQLNLV